MNTLTSSHSAPVAAQKPANVPVIRTNAPSREAIAARAALDEIGKLTLREQADAARVVVEIGGVRTYWSRGLAEVPPYIQLTKDSEHRLLVWNGANSAVHLFSRTENERRFTPLQVITTHAAIFAHLPRYAFVPGQGEHRASFAQLVSLRSLLDLDPTSPIADLHIASATRVIGSVVLEPFLKRVFGADAHPDPEVGAGIGAMVFSASSTEKKSTATRVI